MLRGHEIHLQGKTMNMYSTVYPKNTEGVFLYQVGCTTEIRTLILAVQCKNK